ncbi:Transcriptional regulator, DeoR family [Tepidanaerobacter acetatoxydans Re1]|uniref:Transcriptional regulator, DeoR family n=1 Tax=Tepidanaerobacter acetatoxydans (strain DSM 21804 / JCM 16047 / Re1) TaxID=1209989 RepID=F4LS02_TEPAE|nr:DeoR/GlpR family DNA-binding transcription regulator [Tepidanaerobacter acetatoxydans]AEE92341.1 transcriptional regulator, DeoR family [Tepidanaerobacter acetatoxydans Re1]CCP27229.1 Transcriptional regulator, DeoR family [Tepidanaerobacter acetatoxydans Re1]
MGSKSKRLNQIIALLKKNETMSVKNLSDMLHVSEMTIRRDLNILEADDIIIRSHGKATYKADSDSDLSDYELYSEKTKMNIEKDRIGQFAAGLIEPGDIVIIDNGSTTDKLTKYIPEDISITVLCYNFNVLEQLVKKQNVEIIFAGGYFHPNDQMFESPQGISLIENIRATKLFISAHGVHKKLGLTCANSYEVPTKHAILQSAENRILVADSSKFGKVRTAYFAQLNEIDTIVTDSGITQEWRKFIEDMGIRLFVV